MGKRFKQTLYRRRYTDGKQVHEKMLETVSHKENAN